VVNTTYDPILEARDLHRIRVFALSPPRMGTALVLESGTGEALIIKTGERVPDARLGNYRRSFLVDLSPHGVRMDVQLPSRDPSFLFQGTVNFSCRVEDPVDVARRGIRDMMATVRPSLVRIMRKIAREYDIAEFNAAEAALNEELDKYRGDSAIRLGSYSVELHVGGEDAKRSSTDYHNTNRYTRMEGLRRGAMSEVVAGGRDGLVAQWMAKHGGDPSRILDMEAEEKALEAENLLRAMGILTSSSGETEAFDTRQERRRLLGRFLSDYGAAPELESSRPGTRRSRVAGSLSPGGSVEGVTESAESTNGAGETNGHDRMRGVGRDGAGAGEPTEGEHRPRPSETDHSTGEATGDDGRGSRVSRVRGAYEDRSSRRRPQPRDPDAPER
jgi:hypothetical protein